MAALYVTVCDVTIADNMSNKIAALKNAFLASQDALEVMGVTESLSHRTLADLNDVTLASDDTF